MRSKEGKVGYLLLKSDRIETTVALLLIHDIRFMSD